jgi:hypothetical protein
VHERPGRQHDSLQIERTFALSRATDLALPGGFSFTFDGRAGFI